MKYSDLIYEFLADQDIVDISYRQYKSNVKLFLEWIIKQKIELKDFRTADFIKYKHYLTRDKKHTSLTIANHLMTVRLFYRWIERNGYGQDVTKTIKIRKQYNTFRKKSLTPEQVTEFLKQFEIKTLRDKRDFAIANLMLRNGLREIEVVRLNIADIYSDNDRITIRLQRKGKVEKDAELPLIEKTFESIQEYLLAREDNYTDDDPLFVSLAVNTKLERLSTSYISQMIKQKLTMANILGKYYTAHSLRHTTATFLLANGFSEYQVQTFMGHTNFATTQIYTRQRKRDMIYKSDLINSLNSM